MYLHFSVIVPYEIELGIYFGEHEPRLEIGKGSALSKSV